MCFDKNMTVLLQVTVSNGHVDIHSVWVARSLAIHNCSATDLDPLFFVGKFWDYIQGTCMLIIIIMASAYHFLGNFLIDR
jgi:hypothetical protein